MAPNALYYPYIHIQDANWLKGTLLLFRQVRRMVPYTPVQGDSDDIREFVTFGHLLDNANLWSPRAIGMQEQLAQKILSDAADPEFRLRFGQAKTREVLQLGEYGFQIHAQKLQFGLVDALTNSGLAWKPGMPEPYDRRTEYMEVNERVGQAVMSTLAIACAQGEGLDIVGDSRSGALHQCLIEHDVEGIYSAWLHEKIAKPPSATGPDVFEFMIGHACDLSALRADQIASMGEDREPIIKLVDRLREHAQRIPAMDPGPERDGYFQDEVATILGKWKEDRSNMSGFWRRFWGDGVLDASGKFFEDIATKVADASAATISGALGAVAVAAAAGASLTAVVPGGAAGLAVGLIVHGVKTYGQMRGDERNSPYRLLTTLERAGVVFKSNLHAAG